MEFHFEVLVKLELEHKKGSSVSNHAGTKTILTPSENMDTAQYLKDDELTTDGTHVVTQVLIQGLVANIHAAHQTGFVNDAKHLRYIIKELERGFATSATVEKGEY